MKSYEFQGSHMAEVEEESDAGSWPSLGSMNKVKVSLQPEILRVGSTWGQGCKTQGTENSRHPAIDTPWRYSHLTGSASVDEALRFCSRVFDIERYSGPLFLPDHIDIWRDFSPFNLASNS